MKKHLAVLSLITLVSCPSWALMPYYTGARSEGMGEAFTSLADNNEGLYYNPAALAFMKSKEASAMYWNDYFDTGYSFLSYGMPAGNWGAVSAGWSKTSNTFEKTDTFGSVTGTGEVSNDVYMLGAGYHGGLPVSLGVTAKFINEKIGAFSVSGWALDAGSFVEMAPFRMGLVFQNAVSGGLTGNSLASGSGSVSETLPSTLRIGLSFTKESDCSLDTSGQKSADCGKLNLRYTLAADVLIPTGDTGNYTIDPGAELWLNDSVAIRAGYRELRDYTAGLSLKFNFFRLDYAFVISKELENSNIFSISVFF